MPISTGFIQTLKDYDASLTIGPSQQIIQVLFAISAPYSCSYQVAKLNKNGQPYFDENDLEGQPGNGGYENCYGIRFKSFDPLHPTTVLAFGLYSDDPTPLGFTPSASIFTSGGQSLSGSPLLSGDIIWTGATTRTGAVLADGSFYDGTQPLYLGLWGAYGTTYGGTGQSSFAVPDLRDRGMIGSGGNTALGANDGIPAANRVATRHRHSLHAHGGIRGAGDAAYSGGGSPTVDRSLYNTGAADGGSGVATDPLNGPAYLGLNAFCIL